MTQNISFKLFSLHQVGPFLCSYILGISWHRSTSTRHLSTKLNDLWMKGPYVSIVKPISLFITSLDLKLIPLPKIIVRFSRLELIKAETKGNKIVFIGFLTNHLLFSISRLVWLAEMPINQQNDHKECKIIQPIQLYWLYSKCSFWWKCTKASDRFLHQNIISVVLSQARCQNWHDCLSLAENDFVRNWQHMRYKWYLRATKFSTILM